MKLNQKMLKELILEELEDYMAETQNPNIEEREMTAGERAARLGVGGGTAATRLGTAGAQKGEDEFKEFLLKQTPTKRAEVLASYITDLGFGADELPKLRSALAKVELQQQLKPSGPAGAPRTAKKSPGPGALRRPIGK
jgi:hypothetical protein